MCEDDCTCHTEHAAIQGEVHQINQNLEAHIVEMHARLVDRDTIKQWDGEQSAQIGEIADAVLGARRSEFAGGGRKEEESLIHIVRQNQADIKELKSNSSKLQAMVQNGGVPAKLGAKEKAMIWAAGLAAFANIVVEYIANIRGGT